MVSCSILGCPSRTERKTPNITFHLFPKDVDLRKSWVSVSGRQNWSPTKNSRVCSKHFDKECFRTTAKLKVLRAGALPKRFVHDVAQQYMPYVAGTLASGSVTTTHDAFQQPMYFMAETSQASAVPLTHKSKMSSYDEGTIIVPQHSYATKWRRGTLHSTGSASSSVRVTAGESINPATLSWSRSRRKGRRRSPSSHYNKAVELFADSGSDDGYVDYTEPLDIDDEDGVSSSLREGHRLRQARIEREYLDDGLVVKREEDVVIEENEREYLDNGLVLDTDKDNVIEMNEIQYLNDGLAVKREEDNVVEENEREYLDNGLVLDTDKDNVIEMNEIQYLNDGLAIKIEEDNMIEENEREYLDKGLVLERDKDNVIEMNEIQYFNDGLAIKTEEDNMIEENEREYLDNGLVLERDKDNVIEMNEIQYLNDGLAIKTEEDNMIEENEREYLDNGLVLERDKDNVIERNEIQYLNDGLAIKSEECNVIEENEREYLDNGLVLESDKDNVIAGSEREDIGEYVNDDNVNVCASGPASNVSTVFQWTEDFSSFIGQRETYRRVPGPTIRSQDPVEIFLKFWDEDVMGLIASETNKYARHFIEVYTDPDIGATFPEYLEQWDDVTIPILYQYFAIMICMTLCFRTNVEDYWARGVMEMPIFGQAMSRDTYMLISKFIHFVSDRELTTSGYTRKIGKVAPIVDHCNRKFSELYVPAQHISLDESLLPLKGNLSWQRIVSKGARDGIKSLELCEAATGYLLKFKLYTGEKSPMQPEPLHGIANNTAKVVLELMEGYLDAGHILVMDNWFNQLLLTRYLKSRGTDVLGKFDRMQKDGPQDLKDLQLNHVAVGDWYARHCGDIALVTWKDVKLVTLLSTYHDHQMVPGTPATRAGIARPKPYSVVEYKKYMCGVDLKDQKLLTHPFARDRCPKWYMNVFRRLVNTSLLNAFIIYTKNPVHRSCTHREFRQQIAEGLLVRFHSPAPLAKYLRLQPGNHFPVGIENKAEHTEQLCVQCKIINKRTQVSLMCDLCKVPLCTGKCWLDYHSRKNLANE